MNMEFLQHYWWILISLLGGLLVFLLFVQGGQTLLYTIAKTDDERNLLVNSLGRKWEFTFTTLVVFGGAFFASFPLFYSTSFGGSLPRLDGRIVLFRDAGRFLRVSPESRKPARGKNIQHIPDH